ncbi:CopK family periplasmic copper-binding protein, partial [Pseudomonas aeruginosa]|nr:CopK family periplasmic copper-binding protein [Pseudomonas aeruginosa]MCS8863987.1 CopK family periplasmic copper-binding protein [Pseudomonas aeruginosa]MCS8870339.1 CopK family periplasmic copper-binding protein [Pseudomonas aeruginosa]
LVCVVLAHGSHSLKSESLRKTRGDSQIVIAALLSALSVPAFAGHAAAQAAKEMVPLADGGTLYIFKDGKMAQESRFGRAVYLNVGASVSTKDGRNIAITSNEVARLGSLLQKEHGG